MKLLLFLLPMDNVSALREKGRTEPKGKQGFFLEKGGGGRMGGKKAPEQLLLNKAGLHRVTYPLEVSTMV